MDCIASVEGASTSVQSTPIARNHFPAQFRIKAGCNFKSAKAAIYLFLRCCCHMPIAGAVQGRAWRTRNEEGSVLEHLKGAKAEERCGTNHTPVPYQ